MKRKNWFVCMTLMAFFLALCLDNSAFAGRSGGGGGGSRSYSSGGSRSSSGGGGSHSYSSGGNSSSKPSSKPAASSGRGYSSSGNAPSSKPASAPAAAPVKPPASAPSAGRDYTSSGNQKSSTANETASKAKASSDANKAATTAPKTAAQTKADKALSKQRSAQALNEFKQEKAKFKTPTEPNVASSDTTKKSVLGSLNANGNRTSRTTYYADRKSFYNQRNYQPPTYVYNTSPSFGMWDTLFLFYMLDNISDQRYASMYYNHSDDPGMQKWRQEAEKMAQDNVELKAKLATLDQKVSTLNGTPKDPSYVPPDAGAAVLADNVAEQALPPDQAVSDVAKTEDGGSILGKLCFLGLFVVIGIAVFYVINKAKRSTY